MVQRPPSPQEQQMLNQAVALHQAGKIERATEFYHMLLRMHPQHADALRLLGAAELQLGNFEEGARLLAQAVAITPNQPGLHYNLGSALHEIGQFDDAVASYDKAISLRPDYSEAWFNRGNTLLQAERAAEAVASFDRAIATAPSHAPTHNNRGNALLALGRFAEALAAYDQAVAIQPDFAGAHGNRGKALAELGRLDEAAAGYVRALALDPDAPDLHIDLARLYERQGLFDLALLQWGRMATHFSEADEEDVQHKTMALNQMSRILLDDLREDATAEMVARQSLRLIPDQPDAAQDLINARQRQCAWPVIDPFERVDRKTLMRGISPLAACALTDDPLLQLAINAGRTRSTTDAVPAHDAYGANPDRLRVGYLSSDYRDHPIGHLLYEVPGLHDRRKVEVFAYYCGPAATGAIQEHYKATADHFVDIGRLDNASAAQRIQDDGIHILIDVNGLTLHNRKALLARRPAPVIVNWLGFPGSMGSEHHHYIVADEWIIPPEHEIFFSEKVLRLPCYQPNNRQRVVASVTPTRASAGLPEDAFVFCCFNDTRKLSRHTFDRWLAIMDGVPGSVLWLLSASEATQGNLRAYAARNGVAAGRIIFAEWRPHGEHLARYPLADLFLDTVPYGAHTTCSDALWMGVPVVTLSGRSFASRVGGSLVRQAGLPELVFTRPGDYVEGAIALANDPARLAQLRERLRANRDASVLFDTPLLVARLEDLYRQMWDAFMAGALPTPDLRNLETYLEVGSDHDHEAVEVLAIEDYEGFWRERLAARHATTPIPHDNRMWPGPES